MSGLCKYRDALGEPEKGFHAARIGGFAFWDLLGTAMLAYLGSRYFESSFIVIFIILIIIATILHKMFCVNTTLIKILHLETPE